MPPDIPHHGSINGIPNRFVFLCFFLKRKFCFASGDFDQQMKQSPSQQPSSQPAQQAQAQSQPPPSDGPTYNYSEDQSNDTTAILKLKESMQEEVKKFDKTPNNSNNDDYNHFSGIG